MVIDCYCNYYMNTDKNGCKWRESFRVKILRMSQKDKHELIEKFFHNVDTDKIPLKCSDWVKYGTISQSMVDNRCKYQMGCKNDNEEEPARMDELHGLRDFIGGDQIFVRGFHNAQHYNAGNNDEDEYEDSDDDIPDLVENFEDEREANEARGPEWYRNRDHHMNNNINNNINNNDDSDDDMEQVD